MKAQRTTHHAQVLLVMTGVVGLGAWIAVTPVSLATQSDSHSQMDNQLQRTAATHDSGATGQAATSGIHSQPSIILGRISKIDGESYSITGEHGLETNLRVTKDTNIVCAGSKQAKLSTGQEGTDEHKEIPPTPFMQQQAQKGGSGQSAMNEQQMAQQHKRQGEAETGKLSKDPSQLKGVVGTTDPEAKEDVARGSGFKVGDCRFKVGDQVRVEGDDTGRATTIKQLASETQHSGDEQHPAR